MKKIISVLLATMMLLGIVSVLSGCGGAHEYLAFEELDDGTYAVSAVFNSEKDDLVEAIVPSTFREKPVTKIMGGVFDELENLSKVTIPDSVTYIGEEAFARCPNLTEVVISSKVTEIGDSAFANCPKLTSIHLANSEQVFHLPDTLTRIGNHMFEGCTSLTAVVLPQKITHIGNNAFSKCSSLTSIVLPESITHIGDDAFSVCSSLTNITLPGGLLYIGDNPFSACDALNWNQYDNGFYLGTESNPYYYLHHADSDTGSWLTELEIHPNTHIIGYSALEYTGLTNIEVPSKVIHIGSLAFPKSATRITLPDSLLSFSTGAFLGCDSADIIYNGTTVQWRAIVIVAPVNKFYVASEHTVACTDGSVVFSNVVE